MDYIESFGALYSKKDVRDYKIACANAPVEFPAEFELKMPKVKDQGKVNSCVGHSIATVIEYFNNLQQNNNEEMSVGYIYGNRTNTTHTGMGMYTRDAIAATCKYGDVAKTLFPYNEEIPEIIEKFNSQSDELFFKGEPNRFTSYYRLYTEDEIKTSLMQNGPVIFAIKWYKDIKVVNGVITTSQKADGGGHCMVIYGWDERGWKIQNSWGKFWANGGRAILPYDIKIREAWGIIDTLTNTDTDVVKPYNTKLGSLIAKILNFIINIGYSLIDIFKNLILKVICRSFCGGQIS
jgi:C1A family cysteine protease